jgi:putative ABC transport system substrate-binding protein
MTLSAVAADAQQPNNIHRIGYLSALSPSAESGRAEIVRHALRELGYVERINIVTEYRYAEGKRARYAELVADLLRLKVEAIVVAGGATTIRAAQTATRTVPLVLIGAGIDPVEAGLVESLARPGGNITGITNLTVDLGGKRLELLTEAVPKITRVALLYEPTSSSNVSELKDVIPNAARALRLTIVPWEVQGTTDIESIFDGLKKRRAEAIYALGSPIINNKQNRIVDLSLKSRLPSMYFYREAVDVGGLMSYGADPSESYRRIAYYVDRILKGTKPGELPIEQPLKFEFAINLKTANQIGLTIPPNVLARADKVIR